VPPTDDLGYVGIADLAPRLARRELSPVDLCRALLARCERLEPRLNAFITLAPERILAEARAAEQELRSGRVRGPLHGVPVAVKDLCWTRGERTTGGSKVLGDFIPDEDAGVVARLRAAGAIVFGKTNTPEFAYGPLDRYHYGVTRNPWDPGRFPGGSSMGAAVALAAGLVPGALGSDTGGSIRNPATWSSVTGLKPTYGRVPLRGVVPLATSLDHVGPMARSARDCALLLGGIAGHDPADPTSADVPVPDYAGALGRPLRGLRAAVPRRYFWDALPADIAAAVEDGFAELRRLGVELLDVEIPEWPAAADAALVLIRCEAAAEYRSVLEKRGDELIPQVRERLEAGLATSAPDYVDALRAGQRLRSALARLFAQVDLLALPGRDQLAPLMDEGGHHSDGLSKRSFTSPLNIAGLPALTFPCGFSPEGLPIGLQLAGRAWDEPLLLRVADAYQQATDWHTRRPPLAAPGAKS
jgi:aspartyl-tRNA(Asn)/glutamyl-tRNA(Gln) amidotransferase subunit A